MRSPVRIVASVAVLTSVLVGAAPAAEKVFYNGNKLLEDCREGGWLQIGICMGYIGGVADALGSTPTRACIAASVSQGQVQDVAVKWLEANPQERHYTGEYASARALSKAFPV